MQITHLLGILKMNSDFKKNHNTFFTEVDIYFLNKLLHCKRLLLLFKNSYYKFQYNFKITIVVFNN